MLLIAGSTGLLLLGVLWPQAGHPVLLALPAGADASAAFSVAGWRIAAMTVAGPLALLRAVPDSAAADPAQLRAATGGWITIAARSGAGCSPNAKAP